jgi:rhodanese-related sulfurtransferase
MMPQNIDREQVQQMIEQGAQLVEVLGRSQYRQLHLPKAINIPLQSLDRDTTGKLQKNQPVIVYCHDYQ